jgi:hypothetical protein
VDHLEQPILDCRVPEGVTKCSEVHRSFNIDVEDLADDVVISAGRQQQIISIQYDETLRCSFKTQTVNGFWTKVKRENLLWEMSSELTD